MKVTTSSTFDDAARSLRKNKPKLFANLIEIIDLLTKDIIKLEDLEHEHPLENKMYFYSSFALDADHRVIFKRLNGDAIKLMNVGRHKDVYYR